MKEFFKKVLVYTTTLTLLLPAWVGASLLSAPMAKAASGAGGSRLVSTDVVNSTGNIVPLTGLVLTDNAGGNEITPDSDVVITIDGLAAAGLQFDTTSIVTANVVGATPTLTLGDTAPGASSLTVTPGATSIEIPVAVASSAGDMLVVSGIKVEATQSGTGSEFAGAARLKAAIASGTIYGDSGIIVDCQKPTLSSVTISSNNANSALAKVGDAVTLAFTASENTGLPVVTIAGHDVTPSAIDASHYSATYTMAGGDAEGTVPFAINYSDLNGNTGTEVNTISGGQNVTVDNTKPVITSRETLDRNSDGRLDGIRVVFSESINPSTIGANDFSVESPYVITGASAETSNSLILSVSGSGAFDTAETPDLGYTTSTITDLAGNAIDPSAPFATTDKAAPSIISAKTVTTTRIDATFSENVNVATVSTGDFQITNSNHAVTSTSVSGAVVRINLSTSGGNLPLGTGETPDVAVVGDGVGDAFGNVATSGPISANDQIKPRVVSVDAVKYIEGAGTANEQLELSFSEPMQSAGLAPNYSVMYDPNGDTVMDPMSVPISVLNSPAPTLKAGDPTKIILTIPDMSQATYGAATGRFVVAIIDAANANITDVANNKVDTNSNHDTGSSAPVDKFDSIAPTVIIDALSNEYKGGATTTISWNATDINLAQNSVVVSYSDDDGATWHEIANGQATTGSIDWTMPVINSTTVRVKVSALDIQGNSGKTQSGAFTIDSAAPTGTSITINSGASATASRDVNLSLAAVGAKYVRYGEAADLSSVEYAAYDAPETVSYHLDSANDGTKTVYAQFKDAVGNESAAISDDIELDTTAPNAAVITPVASPTNNPSPVVVVTVDSGIAFEIQNDKGDVIVSGLTGTGVDQEVLLGTLPEGTYTLYLVATDSLLNKKTVAIPVFIVDTTAPVITLNGDSAVTTWYGSNYSDLGATATDTNDGTVKVETSGTVKIYETGDYTITYTATDAAGNSSTKTRKVTVAPKANQTKLDENNIATVSSEKTEVIIPDGAPNATVNIPVTVANSTINLSAVTKEGQAQTDGAITINLIGSDGKLVVSVAIPAGTAITGTSRNGIMNALQVVTDLSGITPTVAAGKEAKNVVAWEVGAGTNSLTFDKAVRILFAGQSGKLAGYVKNGSFTPITTICAADSQATGNTLASGGDCAINTASDLVVWTKHFTKYVTYDQVDKTLLAPVITTSATEHDGNRYIKVEWKGVGANVVSYDIYINAVKAISVLAQSIDLDTTYSQEVKIDADGKYDVYVKSVRGDVSAASETKTVEVIPAAVAPAATETTAPVAKAKQKNTVAPEQPQAEAKTPTNEDENGVIKGDENTSTSENKVNWTPWIVLFILILLTGAATGGYFYWFGGEEEMELATISKPESVAKKSEPAKAVEVKKSVEAAPAVKPAATVKPAVSTQQQASPVNKKKNSQNQKKRSKRW